MPDDYAPVTTPEDEDEEERQRSMLYPPVVAQNMRGAPPAPDAMPAVDSGQSLGNPSALRPVVSTPPVTTRAASASAAPAAADSMPAVDSGQPLGGRLLPGPSPSAASPGSTADLEARAEQPHPYAPVESPASPAQVRLSALTAKGAPPVEPLHGWKKALDIAAQFTRPTQAIEQTLRFRPQREYAANLGQAEKDVAGEMAAQEEPAKVEEAQADPALKEAQTKEAEGRAAYENALANSPNLGRPVTAEQDRAEYSKLRAQQLKGTLNQKGETRLEELSGMYPNLAPMGEAAAGQANARIVDYLSQNPSTAKKVRGGEVPAEYRILPGDTREEAKDKETRAQGLGSAAQRQITINENAGEKGIEPVAAVTPQGTVYESRAAAEAAGHKILNKAAAAEVEKSRQAYTQYGRMIDNAQQAMLTMPAWKEGSKDRELAMRVSKQFFSHIPATGIDPAYADQFFNSDDYRQMSAAGQTHMQNMFQIWSDAINVVKQETGGVPRGQMFLTKEDAILPHPEKTYDMNVQALNSFVKRMKKIPRNFPGPRKCRICKAESPRPTRKGTSTKTDDASAISTLKGNGLSSDG